MNDSEEEYSGKRETKMIGTLTFEDNKGDIRTVSLPGDSIRDIDDQARIILDLFDGVYFSLTF